MKPKYLNHILKSLAEVGDNNGAPSAKIVDTIKKTNIFTESRNINYQVRRALKKAVENGLVKQQNGRYRLGDAKKIVMFHLSTTQSSNKDCMSCRKGRVSKRRRKSRRRKRSKSRRRKSSRRGRGRRHEGESPSPSQESLNQSDEDRKNEDKSSSSQESHKSRDRRGTRLEKKKSENRNRPRSRTRSRSNVKNGPKDDSSDINCNSDGCLCGFVKKELN